MLFNIYLGAYLYGCVHVFPHACVPPGSILCPITHMRNQQTFSFSNVHVVIRSII